MLDNNNKNKNVYTKNMLENDIADECGEDVKLVHAFYAALEKRIADILSTATPDADIVIRLFDGITLNSTYMPKTTKVNNLSGKTITVPEKIKPKANITRYYADKINRCD